MAFEVCLSYLFSIAFLVYFAYVFLAFHLFVSCWLFEEVFLRLKRNSVSFVKILGKKWKQNYLKANNYSFLYWYNTIFFNNLFL